MKKFITIGALFLIFVGFLYGLQVSEASSRKEETARIQKTIEKAAVQGYATHGVYPSSLEALLSEYKLHINQADYQIYYDYNGGNIMPSVHVIRKE